MRRVEHRPVAGAPSGDCPRCCSSERQRSKLRWAHRLESLCSIKWLVAALAGEENTGSTLLNSAGDDGSYIISLAARNGCV